MNIQQQDFVLEVGSGDDPYPRSDILLDKALDDSSEREAGRDLVAYKPLVIGEVEALPFVDGSFDYIIASHVLEHSRDPARFLSELSRVGRRGYIETPLPLRERVFNWPFHRWYVFQKDKKVVLVKKTCESKKFFSGMAADLRKELYHLERRKLLDMKFEWEGDIQYQILESEPKEFLQELDRKLAVLLKERKRDPFYWVQWFKSKLLRISAVGNAALKVKNLLFLVKRKVRLILVGRK